MAPSARFALRWDGFKANAIDALCNLRGEKEFFDVSLIADNGEQVGANKVVLAGGSDFFNKILKENPHPHPLIYMKGVGYEQLVYLLDFIYTGEARILEQDLNQFMDTAQDLKIKGLTLPTPAPRQGQAAAEEAGQPLRMLRRHGVTSTCPEQAAPPSTISTAHTVQSALYQSHVPPEEAPPPLATSLPRSLKSSPHKKHGGQLAPKIFSPNEGQLATEESASAPGITAPHEGWVATADHASSTCMEDHGGTRNYKVEVGDADLFNVYYGTNENGEAYISDVSKRVDAVISALDEGQVDTQERASSNRDIFHVEDHGDVGDTANVNVYYGENNHGEECMKDVSKKVVAKVLGTGLCMEQQKNYQSVSAGKTVLVREENNNSVSDVRVKQANNWYKLETKPSKKCSVNIEKMNISKYTEVSSKSRISSENYGREKSPGKDIAMRSFDKKDMVDYNYDMIDKKEEDMNEQPTHDWGQVNTTHGKQDPLSTKIFGTSSKIKRRERRHTGEHMYCKFCLKKFSSSHLKEHERIHTGEKPFQCPVCLKKFTRSRHLKEHERIHTGEKPFQCPFCPKKFAQSSHLKAHERIHTGEKPFQCEVCLKKFSLSSNLKAHERIHTGEKPFQCEVCLKKFSLSSHLNVHTRIHTGEMPYQCSVCLEKFRHVKSFNRHKIGHTV